MMHMRGIKRPMDGMNDMSGPGTGAGTVPEPTPDKPAPSSFGGKRKRPGTSKPPKSKFRDFTSSTPGSKAGEGGREFRPFPKRSMTKGFPKR